MVVSTIQQPPSTYLTWTRFRFPHPDLGPVAAFSVPTPTYKYIQNGYALMSTIMVLNLWAVVMVCGIYLQLTAPGTANRVNGMAMTLWNTRDAPRQSALGALLYARKKWDQWWYYPFILVLAAAWVASLAAGIFLPSNIFLGNAAPCNPLSIYVPTGSYTDLTMRDIYSIYALEGGPYLRAAAAALVASDEVRGKVKVETPVLEGTWNNTRSGVDDESILRIDYGYNVTGTDLGLQNVPQLLLAVTGSCVTDYTWLNATLSDSVAVDGAMDRLYQDVYRCPWQGPDDPPVLANGVSSRGPSATFCVQNPAAAAATNKGNISWGIVISSVDHLSVTSSQDPWYRTGDYLPGSNDTVLRILPGRPALSCWQNDLWSFKGRSTDVTRLQSILPPDTLSNATADILARYLGSPAVANLGGHIGTAALQSYQGTIDGIFDAGSSSIYSDLLPLILGAYIATINTLADTTLYLDHNSTNTPHIRNLAREEDDGEIARAEVGQFIVFSDQVASLSLTLVILIPFLTLGSWLLMHALLEFTPLKLTKAMEPTQLLRAVRGQFGEPTLYIDHDGRGKWKFSNSIRSKANKRSTRGGNNNNNNTSSTEFLNPPPFLTDDSVSEHHHHHGIHNQDDIDEGEEVGGGGGVAAAPTSHQLVSITAPRLDMDIPLLSPLGARHSFTRRDRDGQQHFNTTTSSSSSQQREDTGEYGIFYYDHRGDNIEHVVGTHAVLQHRPLMGYYRDDEVAGRVGRGGEVGGGDSGSGGGGGDGYYHRHLTDEG